MPSLWENNEVQFARLLCEIIATQEGIDFKPLMASMDLFRARVNELFDRADSVWEEAKRKSLNGFEDTEGDTGCRHEPDPFTFSPADGVEGVVDVNCKHCGTSGSFTVDSVGCWGINW